MGGAPYHKKGRPVFYQNVNGEVEPLYIAVLQFLVSSEGGGGGVRDRGKWQR